MTATATPELRRTAASPGPKALAGAGTLIRFQLRRDRIKLPAWVGGFALFVLYLAAALPVAYETEQDLAGAAQLFQEPVGRLLIGPGYGLDDPTIERLVPNGYGLYFVLLAALMNILLVTRHTRVEEQTGRAELIRANVVGPRAALTATLIVALITNVAAALVVFLLMVTAGGFGAAGSLLFAAVIATGGLAFAGVTVLTVQLSEYSRAGAGYAGIVLGIAFVLRSGGDMAELGGNWLSWLSPLGWAQQTAPFVLDRWWPLALLLVFAVVTAAGGYVLATHRDLGASLLSVRPGRARANPALGTPLGLALRLQRAGLIGWALAMAVAGMAFGAYADALLTAAGDMPDAIVDLFGGAATMLDGYLAYMAVFMAYIVAIYAVLAVLGLRTEETGGRGEPVLATPVSRWAWLGSNLAVIAGGVVAIMLVTGVATGLGAAAVTGDAAYAWELTIAHLNHVPAVLVVLGLAVLLLGVLPRAIAVTWVVVGYGFFVGTFGPILDVAQGAFNVSPFEHAAQLPLEPFAATPLIVLLLIAAATAAVGLVGFRRRNLDLT